MEHVAPETATATPFAKTFGKPILTGGDSIPAQSVGDQKFPRRRLPLHPNTPAASYISLLTPTVIHIENMDPSQALSKEPDAVPEPVAESGCEADTGDAPSKCLTVIHRSAGPDSACVLMTPECKHANTSEVAPTCLCRGRNKIMTSKELGPEKQISEILNKPNLPQNRENKLAPADPANTEARGADAPSLHRETHQPCNCLHVNQFSRILPTDEFSWAKNVDVSGFFKFPPPDMAEADEKMKEAVDLTFHKSSLQGFEKELDDFVERYADDSDAFVCYFEQCTVELNHLREDRRVKFETSTQIQANAESLFSEIRRRSGANVSRVQRDTLKSAIALKAKLDAELKEIDKKWIAKSVAARKLIEQSLIADFDPAKVFADKRKRAQEAENLKAQKNWEADMMSLYRVKQGAATTFQKRAWMWHRVDDGQIQPAMSTYPTGPVPVPRRPVSPVPIPHKISEELKIPPWFTILDSSGRVELDGQTPEARYKSLLNGLQNLQTARHREESTDGGVTLEKTSQKEWHDPNPDWPHLHWQKHGGWWKCRTGLDATLAEQECRLCHQPQSNSSAQRRTKTGPPPRQSTGGPAQKALADKPTLNSTQKHKRLVAEIERAMCQCLEKDRMTLRARMQMQPQVDRELDPARLGRNSGTRGENHTVKIFISGPAEAERHQEVMCYGGARQK